MSGANKNQPQGRTGGIYGTDFVGKVAEEVRRSCVAGFITLPMGEKAEVTSPSGFQRDMNKFIVLKRDDCLKYLNEAEIVALDHIRRAVHYGRANSGKTRKEYVVVDSSNRIYPIVWALVEMGVMDPDSLDIIYDSLVDITRVHKEGKPAEGLEDELEINLDAEHF